MQGRKPPRSPRSVAAAWRSGDEERLVRAVIEKYARMLDACDSSRDVKPLATGLFDALDRLRAMQGDEAAPDDTPLAGILRLAANE